jgi:hypothetical protein
MGHPLTYEPLELRDATRYVKEQTDLLLQSHAMNWRRKFLGFIEAMTLRFECLTLLMGLLDGNRNVDVRKWFADASKGEPAALPDQPYAAMALVWQQLQAAVQKHTAEGFFVTGSSVDLPYVMSNAFPGASLGEKFEHWRVDYLVPFVDQLLGWCDRIVEGMPEEGRFDLWDLSLEVVDKASSSETVVKQPEPESLVNTAGTGLTDATKTGATEEERKAASGDPSGLGSVLGSSPKGST